MVLERGLGVRSVRPRPSLLPVPPPSYSSPPALNNRAIGVGGLLLLAVLLHLRLALVAGSRKPGSGFYHCLPQYHAKRPRGSQAVASDVHGNARHTDRRAHTVGRALLRQTARNPPRQRLVRPTHQLAHRFHCSFRAFSNGDQANSACGRRMVQTALSMGGMVIWTRSPGGIRMRRHL